MTASTSHCRQSLLLLSFQPKRTWPLKIPQVDVAVMYMEYVCVWGGISHEFTMCEFRCVCVSRCLCMFEYVCFSLPVCVCARESDREFADLSMWVLNAWNKLVFSPVHSKFNQLLTLMIVLGALFASWFCVMMVVKKAFQWVMAKLYVAYEHISHYSALLPTLLFPPFYSFIFLDSLCCWILNLII